jgi:hypothetical protein
MGSNYTVGRPPKRKKEKNPLLYGGVTQIKWHRQWGQLLLQAIGWTSFILIAFFVYERYFG